MLMRRFSLPLLLLLLSVSVSAKDSGGAPAQFVDDVRSACERVFFNVSMDARLLTNRFGASSLGLSNSFISNVTHFIESGTSWPEINRRIRRIFGLREKWEPVLIEALRERGLFAGFHEDTTAININRAQLIKLNPRAERYLPSRYRLAFDPFAVPHARAWFAPEGGILGVPAQVLLGDVSFLSEQLMAHELVHIRLKEARLRNGNRRHAILFTPTEEAPSRIWELISADYLQEYSSEEIIAYYVNYLNALESECQGEQSDPEFTEAQLRAAVAGHIEGYLNLMLPSVLSTMSTARAYEGDKGWVMTLAKDDFYLTIPRDRRMSSRFPPQKLVAEVRADLMAEQKVFSGLNEEWKRLSRGANCAEIERGWDALRPLGLDPSEFRIRQ